MWPPIDAILWPEKWTCRGQWNSIPWGMATSAYLVEERNAETNSQIMTTTWGDVSVVSERSCTGHSWMWKWRILFPSAQFVSLVSLINGAKTCSPTLYRHTLGQCWRLIYLNWENNSSLSLLTTGVASLKFRKWKWLTSTSVIAACKVQFLRMAYQTYWLPIMDLSLCHQDLRHSQ